MIILAKESDTPYLTQKWAGGFFTNFDELRKNIKTASLAQLENGVINTNDYLREVTAEEQAILTKITHEIQYLLTQYNLKAQLNN